MMHLIITMSPRQYKYAASTYPYWFSSNMPDVHLYKNCVEYQLV